MCDLKMKDVFRKQHAGTVSFDRDVLDYGEKPMGHVISNLNLDIHLYTLPNYSVHSRCHLKLMRAMCYVSNSD